MRATTKVIHTIELEDDELWNLRYCLDGLNRTTDPVDHNLSDACDYWLKKLPKPIVDVHAKVNSGDA